MSSTPSVLHGNRLNRSFVNVWNYSNVLHDTKGLSSLWHFFVWFSCMFCTLEYFTDISMKKAKTFRDVNWGGWNHISGGCYGISPRQDNLVNKPAALISWNIRFLNTYLWNIQTDFQMTCILVLVSNSYLLLYFQQISSPKHSSSTHINFLQISDNWTFWNWVRTGVC